MFGTGTLGWDLLLFPTTLGVQLELFWMVLPGAEMPAGLFSRHLCSLSLSDAI